MSVKYKVCNGSSKRKAPVSWSIYQFLHYSKLFNMSAVYRSNYGNTVNKNINTGKYRKEKGMEGLSETINTIVQRTLSNKLYFSFNQIKISNETETNILFFICCL